MKKSSLTFLTFALALSMATILLALPSCKSLEPTISDTHNSSLIAHTSHHDTVVVHDSILLHDSVVLRERTIQDTVYITKEVYRDAHNSKFLIQHSTKTDTVVVTEYRDRVVEKPPERYVPPFYRHCTVICWIMIAAGIVYVVVRWRLR